MSLVTMYTTQWCPFCQNAEQFLARKGVIKIQKIAVDVEPDMRAEMVERTGRRTVPQIFVGDTHIGGYEDLVASDRSGQLDRLLGH